ncbi:hypothetical protein [Nitrosomonas ureae]|uniref:hypothetical protein n=1 Tax=Nitrosomonas ureae TaxID=44577 RepID=UPI000BE2E656|nr:hypothetical protein [Nitrosomonas ureae]
METAYFIGEYFRDYQEVHIETGCFIAFSGSTLTATHALNTITEHLAKLQISYKSSRESSYPGEYIVQRHCEYNELKNSPGVVLWDDDMFLPKHFEGLLSYEFIASTIEHSINVALKSAKKYRLSREELDLMSTDFAAGIYCPRRESHHIFVYRMKERQNEDGLIEVFTEGEEVSEDQVAVLGMRKQFEARAQNIYEQALGQGNSTGSELFKFLNSAIDEVAESGSFAIDRPSLHKKFEGGNLRKLKVILSV